MLRLREQPQPVASMARASRPPPEAKYGLRRGKERILKELELI